MSSSTFPSTFGEIEAEEVDVEQGITLRTARVTRRLSVQAQAHQDWVRKRTRRWHAVFAGAVAGGFGLSFEKKRRRVPFAQQLFVR
jgi:hypothetical protein